DESVQIGGAASAESYLVADRIIEAALNTGSQAIHPGYGFLSENATFAEKVDAEGIAFIGPNIGAISAMGDKIESKKLAAGAGVTTIPGHDEAIADAEAAVIIAKGLGFPVMIKASAGGGGKGMRIARSEEEVRPGFESAVNEAVSSFGDGRVFIERFVEDPRHIEVQVMADSYGNVVYLGERECSIQRRHQKVIEEAPSPFVTDELRAEMGAQAVALAKAVDYRSAGTVEFIVDKDRNFFFLEMNTRLQVEHPVTEYVTGLDLVELMIRVASGEKLPIIQSDIALTGWAVESRIYAEDPLRNFMPSIGRLVRYRAPEESAHVRVDTGVFEGGEISMFYDPMIAKLIAGGETRSQAVDRMRAALDRFLIRGIEHNIPFLAAVMKHPRFVEGRLTTAFIEEEFPKGLGDEHLVPEDAGLLVAIAAVMQHEVGSIGGNKCEFIAFIEDEDRTEFAVKTNRTGGSWLAWVDDRKFEIVTSWRSVDLMFLGTVDDANVCVQVERDGVRYTLTHAGGRVSLKMLPPYVAPYQRIMPVKAPPDTSKFLLSPMPGLLIRLSVEVGQQVNAGEELAVVEAMKMENILRAERDGVVGAVYAASGDSLLVDQKILEFE
ncbi:MAG: 2-oxoglutarate carboxylase small subunit, partial [Alphaproteobacteria bacterium MarineAlpha4_Bin2]